MQKLGQVGLACGGMCGRAESGAGSACLRACERIDVGMECVLGLGLHVTGTKGQPAGHACCHPSAAVATCVGFQQLAHGERAAAASLAVGSRLLAGSCWHGTASRCCWHAASMAIGSRLLGSDVQRPPAGIHGASRPVRHLSIHPDLQRTAPDVLWLQNKAVPRI